MLKEHDAEFRRIHVTVIDLIDDDDTLITEQAFLDEHDDLVASYSAIMTLADSANPSQQRRLVRVKSCQGDVTFWNPA